MNSCWMLSVEEGVGVCTDILCDEKTKATNGGLHIAFVSRHFIEGFQLLMVYMNALILQF